MVKLPAEPETPRKRRARSIEDDDVKPSCIWRGAETPGRRIPTHCPGDIQKSDSGLIGVWPGCYWARRDLAFQISASASRREDRICAN